MMGAHDKEPFCSGFLQATYHISIEDELILDYFPIEGALNGKWVVLRLLKRVKAGFAEGMAAFKEEGVTSSEVIEQVAVSTGLH